MTAERCPRCDRATCPYLGAWLAVQGIPGFGKECSPEDERKWQALGKAGLTCVPLTIDDWKERALAAEAALALREPSGEVRGMVVDLAEAADDAGQKLAGTASRAEWIAAKAETRKATDALLAHLASLEARALTAEQEAADLRAVVAMFGLVECAPVDALRTAATTLVQDHADAMASRVRFYRQALAAEARADRLAVALTEACDIAMRAVEDMLPNVECGDEADSLRADRDRVRDLRSALTAPPTPEKP